jgi:L-ascorbate metabolism protein UlaG (beta-lactamase superfamily)
MNTDLTYVGGPTMLITLDGVRFLTDPTFDPAGSAFTSAAGVTLTKTMGPEVLPETLGHIDAVLLSHDHHFDNLDERGRALLPSASAVLTTTAGAERLAGNAVGLAPWDERMVTSGDGTRVRVTATPARHGPAGGDRGPCIGFVLERETHRDGAIYVSGDTVWFEGVEEVIRRFPRVTTAVLFLGAARLSADSAHLTLTAEEGIQIARAWPEATIVPVHHEGWRHFSESRADIERAFSAAGLASRLRW